MAGLVPAIHALSQRDESKTWMPAPSAGMTGKVRVGRRIGGRELA